MSKIYNNGEARPGSIYRIALEDFVTYKEVELYPGLSLNLIIGPNGTGKSTFLCAIILGLCGKTSFIGRAKKISDYVRSGCEQAIIEIELYRNKGQRNVIITRTFDLRDATKWHIDHKAAKEKQVQELIVSLNIQVDNLCQLLPQDRVQDFSKMDPQQLLRSTLQAAGGEAVTQLDQLVEWRTQQRGLATKLLNNMQLLQEQERLNERLKISIDAMEQRKQIESEIQICEKKKLCLEYKDLRDKVVECTNDKNETLKLVNNHKKKINPLIKVIDQAKGGISRLEQNKLSSSKEIHKLKDKAKETLETLRNHEYTLKDIESSLQEKIQMHQDRERELVEAKAMLDKLMIDKNVLVDKVGDESKVKQELEELRKMISKVNGAITLVKKQRMEIDYDLENNVVPQIRLHQNKIKSLENISEERLNLLKSYNSDCYNAVMWLRENRHMFKEPVNEPMMLEISFTDPKYAKYLESAVDSRDLVAFTFESTQDMNLFLRKVRTELGLKMVNAVCSPPSELESPKNDLQSISYLGFYTYLGDTVCAPAAVRRYLQAQYGAHRLPIGTDHTYNNSASVPDNITLFFTENHRFSVRVSSYSGNKSTTTVEIQPAQLLAHTIDTEKINGLNAQLSKFDQQARKHRDTIQQLDAKLATLEVNLNDLNTQRKRITDGVEKVRTIAVQIRLQKKKVSDIESEPALNIEQERSRCRQKQKKCVLSQCKMHAALLDIMTNLQTQTMNGEIWKEKLDISRNSIVHLEAQLRELQTELLSVQTTLEAIESLLARAKSNAKEKLLVVKRSCNNMLPNNPDFPYQAEFDRLPSELSALQQHYCELQTRIACMEEGDEQVIREYEEREKVIEKLRSELNNSSDINQTLDKKMEEIRSKWLPPLENLLREIDKNFGVMFSKLGCAGEIKLEKGDTDLDYDRYGIMILVRFRESEQLQQLTRHQQSGGERAITTAVYLLAMQRLATVPFRCVDEINQGMDSINERKMLQLLVSITTEPGSAQYFLLTPKLLTNLEYNSKVMVHTIMNGKNIMSYKNWNYNKFIEAARRQRAA